MNYLNVDYLIIYAFLLITLIIGLRAGRGIQTIREYAVGNKQFGTVALTLTFLATNIAGASIFNIVAMIADDGIIITTALLALTFTLLFIALFIAPHAAKFPHCFTMGDLVGHFYGSGSQVIAGCLGLLTSLCLATMELSMLGEVGYTLLGWPREATIVLGGAGLAFYAAHGGIKSVTATDVFQFLVLLIGLPILAVVVLEKAGGMHQVIAQVSPSKLQIIHHPEFARYLALALIWLIPLGLVDPVLIQRLLMGQSSKALRTQYLLVAGFDPAFQLTLLLIGLAGMVLYPHVEGLQLVSHIVHHLLPVGIKGLLMAGLLGVIMSTIDSHLHVMGLTAIHDMWQPLVKHRLDDRTEVRYTRYATILLSAAAILAAAILKTRNFTGLLVLSLEFSAPLLMFPLFSGMMGLKVAKREFYTAFVATLLSFVLAHHWISSDQGHYVALVSTLSNGITFFGMHVYRHGGLATVKSDASSTTVWHLRPRSIRASLQQWLPTPHRIVAYSQHKIGQYGSTYVPFGLFCCLNFIFPYFMWGHALQGMHDLMLYLRLLGATLCGLLIVKDKWPDAFLPYLPTFWHFTLLYCLPFTGTVMFLLTKGSAEWLINVAITIMFLIVLVDWLSFVILSALGVALGFLFYQLVIGPIDLHLDFTTGYLLVYTCVFSTAIALLFSSRKEQHLAAKLREISDHYYGINQVKTDSTPAAMRIAAMIDQQVQETIAKYSLPLHAASNVQQEDTLHTTTTDWLHYFFPTALAVIQQGDQMIEQLVAEIKTNHIAPQGSLLSLQACVRATLKAYRMRHPQEIHLDLLEDYRIDTSFNHLQYAIIHILHFLHAHHLGDEVCLRTTRQQGLQMRLPGQALPPALLHDLCTLFPAKATAKHPGLAISKLLIEAQGGRLLYATSTLPHNAYTEFIISLPPAEEKPRTGVEVV